MKKVPSPSISVPNEKLGPAGIRGTLHVLAQMPNEQRKDEDRLRDTALRLFKVSGRLSKAPPVAEDIKGDFTYEDGSSFLLSPQEAQLIRVNCPDGTFEFKKNSQGEHSVIEFDCEAANTAEAKQKFFIAALPFLDLIGYSANCPIYIATLKIDDPKNDCQTIEYISPYRKATVNPHTALLLPELRPVYAMYREAKNSHSDFYKFLCYHKILEGLFGQTWGR